MATAAAPEVKTMHTLPGDAVRQIQWRFAERFDLQMLVQSARTVARTRWRRWWRRASGTPTSGPPPRPR